MHWLRFLALSCFLAAAPAWASVILELTSPDQTANPGQTIVFGGFITNNSAQTIDLNGINITLAGPFTFDTSPFFDLNAPISVDGGGAATLFYDWFTVAVLDPYADPFGVVNGTITLVGGFQGPGGYDPSIQDPLATIGFSINVAEPPAGAVVPEPGTSALFLLGAGCLAARWLRKSCSR